MDASKDYRRAIALDPQSTSALLGLAWLLAGSTDDRARDGAEALRLAERGCALTQYQDPRTLDALAAANAELRKYDRAIELAERAREQARQRGNIALTRAIDQRLERYRCSEPYRGPTPPSTGA
jgi:tetratricopeptide (TPR) repeat protein